MARDYRMRKRAEARDETRERILRATMEVHDEKGVAPATLSDIAQRAGVGLATVSRHFPSYGELVQACGMHVWQEMRPPVPPDAPAMFEGVVGRQARLARMVAEIDAFYARGAHRLALAGRDRELVPQLDGFLGAVEAGIAAVVAEALRHEQLPERALRIATALMGFPVWAALKKAGLRDDELSDFRVRMLDCALVAAMADTGR
jgi:AcrR family transcriptional regulator